MVLIFFHYIMTMRLIVGEGIPDSYNGLYKDLKPLTLGIHRCPGNYHWTVISTGPGLKLMPMAIGLWSEISDRSTDTRGFPKYHDTWYVLVKMFWIYFKPLKLNLLSFFICFCQHHERKTICLYRFLISDR